MTAWDIKNIEKTQIRETTRKQPKRVLGNIRIDSLLLLLLNQKHLDKILELYTQTTDVLNGPICLWNAAHNIALWNSPLLYSPLSLDIVR